MNSSQFSVHSYQFTVDSRQFTEFVEITSPSVDEWLVMTRGGGLTVRAFLMENRYADEDVRFS